MGLFTPKFATLGFMDIYAIVNHDCYAHRP
jgi:hypothetical protein